MNFTTLIILIFTAILAIGSVSKGLKRNHQETLAVKTIESHHNCTFMKYFSLMHWTLTNFMNVVEVYKWLLRNIHIFKIPWLCKWYHFVSIAMFCYIFWEKKTLNRSLKQNIIEVRTLKRVHRCSCLVNSFNDFVKQETLKQIHIVFTSVLTSSLNVLIFCPIFGN